MQGQIREDESPSEAVKRLVAEREECSPRQLGKLTDAVDVAKLDAYENHPVEFQYCGYRLTLTSDETIHISK
jgi:hypothetical protein